MDSRVSRLGKPGSARDREAVPLQSNVAEITILPADPEWASRELLHIREALDSEREKATELRPLAGSVAIATLEARFADKHLPVPPEIYDLLVYLSRPMRRPRHWSGGESAIASWSRASGASVPMHLP